MPASRAAMSARSALDRSSRLVRVTAYRLSLRHRRARQPDDPAAQRGRQAVEAGRASRRRRPCAPGRARRSAARTTRRSWERQAMSRIRSRSPPSAAIRRARVAPHRARAPSCTIRLTTSGRRPAGADGGHEPRAVARDQEGPARRCPVTPGHPQRRGAPVAARRTRPAPRPRPGRPATAGRRRPTPAAAGRSAPLTTWRTLLAPARTGATQQDGAVAGDAGDRGRR